MFELCYDNNDELGSVSTSANKLIQIKWFKEILNEGLLYPPEQLLWNNKKTIGSLPWNLTVSVWDNKEKQTSNFCEEAN